MKGLLNKSFFLCVFIFTTILNAQNLTNQEMLEFYPNNIGNSWSYWWVYYNAELDYYEAGRDKIVVSKDTVVNNLKYWLMEYDNHGYGHYAKYLERIDSATGNVLRIDGLSSEEIFCIDNLYARVGDTISISNNRYLLYCDKMVVISIHDTILNNFQTTIREVEGIPYSQKLIFARKIGLLGSGKNFWIDSAKVNGIIFSNITDIKEDGNHIESEFVLHQNYPNPFNPTTKISYSVSKPSKVQLIVYNVLGKEIAKLVDQEMSSGNYSIDFDGANLASGIYFYQIKANDFIETKKMILLR